ncbi:unnamed protein product [Closterium sp. Yama58-4]|nr:unnamed protein product [Closterium sp. Yama58-4]
MDGDDRFNGPDQKRSTDAKQFDGVTAQPTLERHSTYDAVSAAPEPASASSFSSPSSHPARTANDSHRASSSQHLSSSPSSSSPSSSSSSPSLSPLPSLSPSPHPTLLLPAVSSSLAPALAALVAHQVIAVPTDTIYGFAADARSAEGIARIYKIKGRDFNKPLAIAVADIADVAVYAETEHLPPGLLPALLPGPVTLVLPHRPTSPIHPSLTRTVPSIAVRIPDSPFIRSLARLLAAPLALTSANLSGHPSAIAAGEFRALWGMCAAVVDGGEQGEEMRQGSTIVELVVPGRFRVIRPGSALPATLATLHRFNLEESLS